MRMLAGGDWLYSMAGLAPLAVIQYLVSKGFDPHATASQEGDNALCSAACRGCEETVAWLLDQGVRMDTSLSVRNPLFAAIGAAISEWDASGTKANPQAVIRLLMDRGIDASVEYRSPTMNRLNAAGHALRHDLPELAELICRLQAGGNELAFHRNMKRAREAADRQKQPSPYTEWIEYVPSET